MVDMFIKKYRIGFGRIEYLIWAFNCNQTGVKWTLTELSLTFSLVHNGLWKQHRIRCKTCPFVTEGTTSYTFFSTNEERRIWHHITSSSANLVYIIQCNKFNVQYIGETKRHLSDIFGEHRGACATKKGNTQHHIDQRNAVLNHRLYPSCPFYGQHRTRSFRTHWLK